MVFYDLDVRGEEIGQISEFAKKLGWNGLCFVLSDLDKLKGFQEGAKRNNTTWGIEISGKDYKEIIKKVKEVRTEAELIIAYSPNLEITREILEIKEIDVLRQDVGLGLNPVLAKLAKENNIAIEFRFTDLLHSHKRVRAGIFKNYIETARLLRKFRAPFVITSGAMTKWDLRGPSEMLSFGRLLGFQDPEIKQAMSDWIIKENRKRLSGKWVMPGVEIE